MKRPGLFFFPRSRRLVHARQYQAVYAADVRAASGPLVVWGAPSDAGFSRLGLSISKRAGGAAVRNRIKRLLREAFRLHQRELPPYDLVVNVRPHEPMALAAYERALTEAAGAVERSWKKRKRDEPRDE